jgi:hypothetical protein
MQSVKIAKFDSATVQESQKLVIDEDVGFQVLTAVAMDLYLLAHKAV